MQFSTLSQLLQWRASESPEEVAYIFLPEGEETEQRITYGQLDRRAKAAAAHLQSFTAPGERAVLLFPPGLDFIVALFGCFYSGVIAVPAYPPRLSRRNRSDNRIESIIKDAQPSAILSLSVAMDQMPGIRFVAVDQVPESQQAEWKDPQSSETDLAFLQYTSGSTAAPKGVMLSHANILHNERMIQTACEHTEASTFVGWLPLYHDMGLIGNVLQPLYLGAKSILMAPNSFLQKPVRWLSAITRYQARTSGGPNFAYDLCVRKITAEQKEDLDLRSWTVAFNGAEPVRQETLERFARAFEVCGFRSSAFFPCYGLAETSLIVTGGTITAEPFISRLAVRALEKGHVEPQSNSDGTRTFVGCGAPVVDCAVSIVNPETCLPAKQGEVGEIWVSGPSVASGYWGRTEATEKTFKARLNGQDRTYLRTHDCGFMLDGQLFITGRLQDMIIIRGQNYHPEDIEWTIQQAHASIPIHTSAAFSVDESSEERLVVLIEVDHRKDINLDDLVRSVRYAVAEQHEVQVAVVGLVKVGALPKTSSGKIQRHVCRQKYLSGMLELLACSRLGDRVASPASLTRERLVNARKDERRLLIEQFLQTRVCELIKVDQIDPAHPLIAIGIDSLSAIELTTIIETHLGVAVSLESALSGASLSDIANLILERIEDSLPEDSSEPASVTNLEYPLSYAQHASWVLYKKDPENVSQVMARAARIDGNLDIAALERAFRKIALRHPCLRTIFSEREGWPVQIVQESASIGFTVEDARGTSEQNLLTRMKADVNRSFNLESGPIFRVHLYKRYLTEHYLVLSLHHIVCDLWSFGLILNELGPTYTQETSGLRVSLPAPATSYEEFVTWQDSMTKSDEGREHWTYWQRELAGELPVLDLPTDYGRPASGVREAAELHFHFPKPLRDDLDRLAKQNQCTMNVLLLTAFQVLLHRYSGQDDIIIGAPASGRDQERWSNLVGYFANTIPLRSTLAAGERFTEALARTRKKVIDSLTHQRFPFPLLVERLQPARETNRAPLFQVLFVFQNIATTHRQALQKFALGEAGAQVQIGDLKMESIPVEHTASEYDLILTLAEVEGGIGCLFKYSTDLYDKTTATRIIQHFENLLTEIVEDATTPVRELCLLSEAEQSQLIFEWARNDTPFGQGESLVTLFARRVAQRPHAVALEFEGSHVSYEKLEARANQMARHLLKLGVGPDVSVAVCLERSLDLIEAILGVVKAGGVYVPLDPAYPSARLSYMIEDARAAVLICEQTVATNIATGWTQVVCLDDDRETIERESELSLPITLDDHNLAYVSYTSGSTGTPKGVAVTHRNVVRLVNESTFVTWDTDDIYLQLAPVSFDASTFEIWGSLLNGCRLNIHPPNSPTLNELGEFIQRQRVTVLWLTAGLFDEMVEWEIDGLKPVRQLLAGGDALSVRSVKKVLYELPECRLINGYGPTESTTFATTCDLRTAYKWNESVPIGRPIANTEVYVVDEAQQVLPVGVYGELCIGGVGLARGYLNRPELTAERFVPHPYSATGGARLYRTGDVVRWNGEGQLEFRGRADHQVKVRGYRIELGEIEAALRSCSGVKQAVVLMREQQLVGYVVSERAVSNGELRAQLSEKLPQYMVPAVMVELAELPLTANGKLDRKALPEPELSGREQEYAGPRTPVEELLAGIFAEVLKLERVGRDENFFELGGHSLLATQVVSRVQLAFSVELPLRTLFEAPTVGGLAVQLEQLRREGSAVTAPALEAVERSGKLPLSFAQQRLWFIDQLEPESVAYNIPAAVRLRGKLNVEALRRSFTEIVRRHEVLRTRFVTEAGEPQQVIGAGWEVELPVLELSETAAREWAAREASQPFVLSEGPLLRLGLARLSEEEHVLAVTMHHIISDGWSVGVLIREVSALYEAYSRGEESPLSELTVQYGDFAVWQREWLQGAVLEQQLSYWREQLAGLVPLELPTDRPRPAVPSHRGAVLPFSLGTELSNELRGLSQRAGVTLFMTLLAGFQLLLSKYSNQSDIAVGTDVANRNRAETEGLIGFFVNQLVLRVDLSGDLSFSELLKQVREVTLGAYEHQDLPFERLVKSLMPERDLSRTPLFQVKLVLQNARREQLKLADVDVTSLAVDTQQTKFDLSVFLEEHGGHISGELEYSSELFDATTMASLLRHYQVLLDSALAQPQQALHELPLLSETEREQVLRNTKGAEQEWGATESLTQLLAESSVRVPDRIAVVYEDECLSYGELHARAEQVAKNLQLSGVGPDAIVGVCMERNVELVVALLGVLNAGGAYLPLDVNNPTERLRYVCEDAGARVVLTKEHLQSKMKEIGAEVHCVERLMSDSAGWSRSPGVANENLAYVIYTSGSTGQPKGAMNTHGGIINRLLWMQAVYEMTDADVVLQKTTFSFDVSVWEFFWPLLAGARLELARVGAHGDSRYLAQTIRERQISIMHFVPSMLDVFLRDGAARQCETLREVISSGEDLGRELVGEWFRQSSGARLHNLYGPTEAAIDVTYRECNAADEERGVGIGRPIANTEVYVVDEAQQVLPVGVYGELCIGGVGLARGYLNRPELTAERFVPHPYSATGGARLYRTGDVVRWNAEGQLEFRGRADHQVKVRGYRIELGEIEAALRSCSGVKQAVVLAREQQLVGYVVSERAVSSSELRAELSEKLPQYMVPAVIVELAELPLTASGKLDRKALPEPELSGREQEYAGPRTPVEELLAGIFAEVLKLERVGRDENFFELGGHSLLATQVVSRVQLAFGVELPLRTLFEAPTVGGLAVQLEQLRREGSAVTAPALEAVERSGKLPLSFAQQRLWFIDQLEPESVAYNIPAAVRLRGKLNVEALRRSFTEIVRRHEVLRTRFVTEAGEPQQVIGAGWEVELPVLELSEAEAREWAAREAAQPFVLSEGPLLRLGLARLSEEEHVLAVTMHHIISDGWSVGVLIREVSALYEAYSRGEESPLSELTVQYGDFAVWQREWLQGAVLEQQLDYWREQLVGLVPLELPTDRPRPAVPSHAGAVVSFELNAELTAQLKALTRCNGVTPFMTLLAGFQLLLSKYSNQSDIAVGTPVANRAQPKTEQLIGFFVNQLVLRADLSGDPSFSELLKQVRETTLGAYEHQDLPFERLVESLMPERDLSRTPLFQVMLVMQNTQREELQLAGLELERFADETRPAKFDLALELQETSDGIRGTFEYSTDIFNATTISRLAVHFQRLLERVVAQPDRPLSQLSLLTDIEREQLLVTWSHNGRSYEQEKCIDDLFAEQAAQTPDQIAAVSADGFLTYRLLHEQSSRLAQLIKELQR